MRTLYVTTFDTKTKKCIGPSVDLHTNDREGVQAMFGKAPLSVTKNTMIFSQAEGQALCVSWIRFAL